MARPRSRSSATFCWPNAELTRPRYNRRMSIHMRSTMRRLFLRLAFLAVLLNALAPSVSHAIAASQPAIPIDVCSEHGGPQLAVAIALLTQDQDRHHGGLLGDCGYCLTHAGSAGMPPPSLA